MVTERVMWPEKKDGKIPYLIERVKQLTREFQANVNYKTGNSSHKNNKNRRGYVFKSENKNNKKHGSRSDKNVEMKLIQGKINRKI